MRDVLALSRYLCTCSYHFGHEKIYTRWNTHAGRGQIGYPSWWGEALLSTIRGKEDQFSVSSSEHGTSAQPTSLSIRSPIILSMENNIPNNDEIQALPRCKKKCLQFLVLESYGSGYHVPSAEEAARKGVIPNHNASRNGNMKTNTKSTG